MCGLWAIKGQGELYVARRKLVISDRKYGVKQRESGAREFVKIREDGKILTTSTNIGPESFNLLQTIILIPPNFVSVPLLLPA